MRNICVFTSIHLSIIMAHTESPYGEPSVLEPGKDLWAQLLCPQNVSRAYAERKIRICLAYADHLQASLGSTESTPSDFFNIPPVRNI